MIIKPWTDLPPPRHLLEEDAEDEDASIDNSIIPIIDIELTEKQFTNVIVTPSTLGKIVTNIGKAKTIGKVNVTYPKGTTSDKTNYDEDTQLYNGTESLMDRTIHRDMSIELLSVADSILFISVPYITDPIVTNLIAYELIPKISYEKLIAISIDNGLEKPFYLTNISDLEIPLSPLTPPAYVATPISSFISKSVANDRNTISLSTNDGTNDVIEVCQVLKQLIPVTKSSYIADCRKHLSYSNSLNGLYV